MLASYKELQQRVQENKVHRNGWEEGDECGAGLRHARCLSETRWSISGPLGLIGDKPHSLQEISTHSKAALLDVVPLIACPSALNAATLSPSFTTFCTAATRLRSRHPQLAHLRSQRLLYRPRQQSHGMTYWRGQPLEGWETYG